ncbi:glutamate decarboxylase [Trichoderma citrinoviride]|uniref:Glutamate decarboxylase n=1 Tax=Trichoderma citrinoviride TaxID=58853 RepID=A0A2T4B3D7_9HYPO|nr:glutamate decarboxylase [Trichoderma citrinoviride]PTB63738.1 glutamate decarboxylase [Trichoderma citrinoviride]
MVHLTAISRSGSVTPSDERAPAPPAAGASSGPTLAVTDNTRPSLHKSLSQVKLSSYADEFTTSVYGSQFAGQDLPKHSMPAGAMPRDVAYHMIKDHLSLDNNPKLNLASFVTTYMEDEAEKLMTEAFSKNFIDYEEYPQSADIQNRCVNMIGDLFHAPAGGESVGTSCIGSSEAIMLAVLAMKRRWKLRRQAEGKPADRPNIVMSSAVQVCWEKAARYFEVEEKYVYCTETRYTIDPEEAVNLIDENTIGIAAILGTTYTGHYEDVKGINDLLVERGLDVPIHVDAASGGFVAPFVLPDLEWDFRLPQVVSINVSGHKYGLVYPGVGWVVWRSHEYLPQDLIFNINYLGAEQSSFTLNFSKGASQVIGQYYQFIRLGRRGYESIMSNLTRTADYLTDVLEQSLGFVIMSERNGQGLPLVAFRFKTAAEGGKQRHYDEFALAHHLRSRGWVVPAYTMAPHTDQMKMLRVVVREDFSKSRCDLLIHDIKLCLAMLENMDAETVRKQEEFIKEHISTHGKNKTNHRHHASKHYTGEEHSLQGKTGKTHAIC